MSHRWEDPIEYPTGVTSNPNRHEQIADLRGHKGEWAVLSEHKSPGAARTVKRRLKREWGSDYEFVVRKGDGGAGKIYGRYVGLS